MEKFLLAAAIILAASFSANAEDKPINQLDKGEPVVTEAPPVNPAPAIYNETRKDDFITSSERRQEEKATLKSSSQQRQELRNERQSTER